MASMMGRSCSSYGVHFRSCLPSSSSSSSSSTCNAAILSFSSKYTCSSTATSKMLYFTGLSNSSCFLPCLSSSSSSFRTRRAKLFTATLPSSSSSSKEFRSRRFSHRLSASQEGNDSSNGAGSVCFPPPHTAQKDSSDMEKSSSSPPSPPPSSSHINLLQGLEETSSSSSSLPSLFSAKLPRKATRRTSSKKNENVSAQVELTSASQEASEVTLLPAMSPRKATRRVSPKEKENFPAETGLVSTSEETSSQLLSAILPKKITRKKKESSLLPPLTSSSTELSSTIDETSSASVPKKVTRKRKRDESLASQSLSSFEDHSSETMLTSDGISATKRVNRKKKDSTISQVSVSSDDKKELSPFTLEETSSASVSTSLTRRSRRRKADHVSSEENQIKDPKISSSAILEEVLISPVSPGRVSRKKKNDTLLSEVTSPPEVHLTSDGKITSSVLTEAPLSPKKVARKNQGEGFLKHSNKVESSGALAEKNIHGDGNSAGNLPISPLMLSKKLPNKKETDYNVLAESSISSFADDLNIGGNIISSIKEEDTSPKKREERKKMQSITSLEDHLITPTSIEGKQGGISGENINIYGEKILGKPSLMKENSSLLDIEKEINLTTSNKGETDTSLWIVPNISSAISLQAPLEEKNLLPNLFELDDFMFSDRNYIATDDRTHKKSSDIKNSTKPTSIFGSFKSNQPLERELKKEDVNDMQHLNEKVQSNDAMNSQSKNAEQKTKGSENTMKEDHFNGTRMKDMSMSLKLGESEQNIEGRFYKTNRRSDLPNDPTKYINMKDSIRLRRENFENQSARGKNGRDTLERQEHVRSRMDGKSLFKNSRVNDNGNKVKQYSYGNDSRAVKIIGRSNEKFGNQNSSMWRNNSREMEGFQGSERYSQGGQYLLNTHRARGMDRKERKQFSVRNVLANQASTISYMQIYGTGFDTGDTVPTVFLFFDRRRFIFNVGEGLLRFCMEHRFKPSKIDHVFLTRVCTETTGGLPGLIFTLAELGESGIAAQTWGPANLQNLGKALRTFVPSGWLEHAHCFGPEDPSVFDCSSPIFLMEDELIKISAVLLYHEDQSSTDKASNLFPECEQTRSCRYDCPSTVYICELSEVKGKFDPAKALAKGLKPGYKYGKLQKGESVVADDGITMVHPDDVLGPSSPGPIMILVDCPSLSYLPSLVSSKGLQSYFSDSGKVVNCMVHITPISVTSSKEYQNWMENFKDTHHIMAYQQLIAPGKPTLRCSAATLSKLNFVCPQLFPMVSPESKIPQYENLVDGIKQEEGNKKICVADNLLKFRFRPLANLGLDDSDVPSNFDPNISQTMEAIKAREISMKAFENWSRLNSSSDFSQNEGYRVSQKLPPYLKGVSREEMEFIFLGTGSSQPSRHRNVTSIYVHLFKHGGILLDCGEGTYAQLKRRYGLEGADEVLMGLKLIWISHMHADHFTGLVRVLSVRRKLLQDARAPCERLLVIGPKQLRVFLDAYGAIEDLLMDFLDCSQTTFDVEEFSKDNDKYAEQGGNISLEKIRGLISVPTENSNRQSQMQNYWMYPGFHIQQGVDREGRQKLRSVLNSLGLKDLFSIPVVHCPNAFAVVIQAHGRKLNGSSMERGWKFVFSGDTRPCRAVIEAARGATILIHEATFDDGMLPEAIKKNHSITKEAIEVGVAAGVYRIFLTHFSQRYPAVPIFDTSHNNITSIAFDMMTVNLADLPVVPEILPAFRLLFSLPPEDEDSLNL